MSLPFLSYKCNVSTSQSLVASSLKTVVISLDNGELTGDKQLHVYVILLILKITNYIINYLANTKPFIGHYKSFEIQIHGSALHIRTRTLKFHIIRNGYLITQHIRLTIKRQIVHQFASLLLSYWEKPESPEFVSVFQPWKNGGIVGIYMHS